MQQLKDRIRKEGKVLPGNIIKVDGFLNHRVDTRLMGDIADEIAKYFDVDNITMVLTAEASGIALATICAQKYNVPMVFAKKAKSDNIEGGLYQSEIFSYTYKKKVTQILSKEWLTANDKVLIIDDFMANGEAVRGLCDLVNQAGAELMGIGIAVEKGFQGGGDRLREAGFNYHALAVIEKAERDGFVSTLLGRRRYLNEVNSSNYATRETAKRAALNAPVQGSAADLIKVAMIKVGEYLKEHQCKTKMVLQIHDELLFALDKEEEATLPGILKSIMENALPLPVKLKAEIGIGNNYDEAK